MVTNNLDDCTRDAMRKEKLVFYQQVSKDIFAEILYSPMGPVYVFDVEKDSLSLKER